MLFAILLLSPFAASVAPAQVVPSVLEEVRLVTEDAEISTFMLRFSPAEPRVADNNSDPARPEVIMTTTLRAGRVAARQTYRGLVRTMIFTDQGGSLVVRFETALPASVKSERMGNNAVHLKVTRVTDEERLGSRPIGSAGEDVVPQQDLNRPVDSYQPGDSYELVFLKYADVSEVIGLLVEGAKIAPNDIFIRREPGFGSPASNQQPSYMARSSRRSAIRCRWGRTWATVLPSTGG